jgi:hypothetical protein
VTASYHLDGKRAAPRAKRLRRFVYAGSLRANTLTVARGAHVVTLDAYGAEISRRHDVSARLSLNIGDAVVIVGADIASLIVVAVEARAWSEAWRVAARAGACPDGPVHVIPAWKAKP